MKTAEYIKKYNFNIPSETDDYNFEGFLKDFGDEFKSRVEVTIVACHKMQVQYTYGKFLNSIKETKAKFESISNKKVGRPLSDQLFSRFFATYVIPIRSAMFPSEQEAAAKKRAELQKKEGPKA